MPYLQVRPEQPDLKRKNETPIGLSFGLTIDTTTHDEVYLYPVSCGTEVISIGLKF